MYLCPRSQRLFRLRYVDRRQALEQTLFLDINKWRAVVGFLSPAQDNKHSKPILMSQKAVWMPCRIHDLILISSASPSTADTAPCSQLARQNSSRQCIHASLCGTEQRNCGSHQRHHVCNTCPRVCGIIQWLSLAAQLQSNISPLYTRLGRRLRS